MKSKTIGILGSLGTLFAYFVLYQIATGLIIASVSAQKSTVIGMIILLILGIAAYVAVIYFLFKEFSKYNQSGITVISDRTNRQKIITLVIAAILMGILLLTETKLPVSENQNLIDSYFKLNPAVISIQAIVFAPAAEELIFRGLFQELLFKRIDTRAKMAWFIVVSGLVFGFVHTMNLSLTVIPYIVMGLILAGTYAFTKDIKYSIALHMLVNIVGVITMF